VILAKRATAGDYNIVASAEARTLVVTVMVAVLSLSSIAASAQQQVPGPVIRQLASREPTLYERRDSILEVGAGIVVGAVAGYYLLTFQGSMILGGLAGGIISHWLFIPSPPVSVIAGAVGSPT
jgi:hypothetical protein